MWTLQMCQRSIVLGSALDRADFLQARSVAAPLYTQFFTVNHFYCMLCFHTILTQLRLG